MIHSVTVTNDNVDKPLEMILTQPELSGFVVKSIDGLGPNEATVNFTELATIDGAIENSCKIGTREIKLDLIFLEKNTIEETRLISYKYFPVKKKIKLTVQTDHRKLHCYGTVERNEPKIFSKQEGCTITVKCGDPFFHTDQLTTKMFYGVEPMFEFEYSNESTETQQVAGRYYDTHRYATELTKAMLGKAGYTDRIHVQLIKKVYRTFTNSYGHTITYYTYDYIFDKYISKLSGDEYYMALTSDELTKIFENNDVQLFAKKGVSAEDSVYNDPEIVTDPNAISVTGWIRSTASDSLIGTYILSVCRMELGQGGTALVEKDTEFGLMNVMTEGNVVYDGEADTGFILEIIAKGHAHGIKFYDMETGEMMQLSDSVIEAKVGSGIDQGDVITINTIKGQKSVTLMRDGVITDIINALIPTQIDEKGTKRMQWLVLHKGDNVFGYATTGDPNNSADTGGLENLVFNVKYDALFEGV